MRIDGIDNLTAEELEAGLAAGGRFVVYEYCISLVVLTRRCPTAVRYLPPEDWGLVRGLPYVLVSLLLGWWGVPWGIIYTPLTIFTNLCGGHDVTDEVWDRVQGDRGGAGRSVPPARPAE
ncbi:MAG: hypothetical protein ACJ8F7_19205 [Gemmataceae bacterium]